MNHNTHATVRTTAATPLDTFLAISRIYFSCAERLSAHNSATARQVIEDCARGSKMALDTAAGQLPAENTPATTAQLIDKTLAYSRNAYEIFAHAHEQVTDTMIREFSDLQTRISNPESWRTAFGMFTSGTGWPLPMRAPLATTKRDAAAADHATPHGDEHHGRPADLSTRKAA